MLPKAISFEEPDEADLIKLEAAASTTERLQVIGCRYSHEVSRREFFL